MQGKGEVVVEGRGKVGEVEVEVVMFEALTLV